MPTFAIPKVYFDADDTYRWLKKDSSILWHYTDFDACRSILGKNELWATDYRFMNDSTELLHALRLCFPYYQKYLPHVGAVIEQFLTSTDVLPSAEVLSFSGDFDSLEQWRGYSQNTVGVALGFDRDAFDAVARHYGFERLECKYTFPKKKEVILEHCKNAAADLVKLRKVLKDKTKDDGEHSRARRSIKLESNYHIREFLQRIVLSFKDESFQRENGTRYVSPIRGFNFNVADSSDFAATADTAIRKRAGTLIPYSKLPLAVDRLDHPLKAVLFGPVPQADVLRQRAVRGELRTWLNAVGGKHAANYHPNVLTSFSKIPLR